jgi:hypothetical protein
MSFRCCKNPLPQTCQRSESMITGTERGRTILHYGTHVVQGPGAVTSRYMDDQQTWVGKSLVLISNLRAYKYVRYTTIVLQ